MDEITLSYNAWKRIDPRYRSVVDGVPVAVVYDDGDLTLMRVRFERPQDRRHVERCAGQHGLFAPGRRSAA